MNDGYFVLNYVQECASGKLAFNDCGPVWQFGVIAFALVATIILLLALMTPAKPVIVKS